MKKSPKQTKINIFLLILLIFVSLVFSSCTTTQPASSSNTIDTVLDIEVIPSGQLPERVLLTSEQIPQNNCGSSGTTSNTFEKKHIISYTIELGAGLSVNANGKLSVPGVGEVGVGSEVAAQYGVSYGVQEELSRSITVEAGPGSNILHHLNEVAYWETGEIVIHLVNGVRITYPYRLQRDFGIEQVDSENLGCNIAQTVMTTTPILTDTVQATSVITTKPVMSSTPTPPNHNNSNNNLGLFRSILGFLSTNIFFIVGLAIIAMLFFVGSAWVNADISTGFSIVLLFFAVVVWSIVVLSTLLFGVISSSTFLYVLLVIGLIVIVVIGLSAMGNLVFVDDFIWVVVGFVLFISALFSIIMFVSRIVVYHF